MGVCASHNEGDPAEQKNAKQQSKALDQALQQDHATEQQVNKLLLLGAGGSGKSTLFKQMITIYGKGFSEQERSTFTNIIYSNIILSSKVLVEQSATYGPMDPSLAETKKYIEELREDEEINEVTGRHLKLMWEDSGIQATYEKRSKYQLNDSTKYFLSKIEEVAKEGYVPSEQDVLRSRIHTTGIVENNFDIDGNAFKMLDVGGQRSERKKWVHCFDSVTAVIFVAAISEYDQVLFEDESTNRLVEAVDLFEEITNSEWFARTAMILFLNKRDLFAEKIKTVPLSQYYPAYGAGDNYEAACDFMKELFESRSVGDKDIYTHLTCATDTNNIFTVFTAVKDIIIKRGLARAGLM